MGGVLYLSTCSGRIGVKTWLGLLRGWDGGSQGTC